MIIEYVEAADERARAPLRRRTFLACMGLSAAGGAAGALQFGPAHAGSNSPTPAARPAFAAPPPPPPIRYGEEDRAAWMEFRRRFVTADGRVVDTGNGGESHSEGQGWGLLMACALDDVATFARVLDWTQATLACRGDALHAWRFRPGQANPVDDPNTATDGELYIAAALARAAVRWNRPDFGAMGAAIARDILRLSVRQVGPRMVLLPGAAGFEHADGAVVNPSYYTFALFADLAAICPSPLWGRLAADGLALVQQACTGPAMLPPDWVRVDGRDGRLSPAPGWPPRFSYDAIRVPLHLAWGRCAAPELIGNFRRYWAAGPHHPAWADLRTGAVSPYAASAGMRAVAAVATNSGVAEPIPSVMEATDYYSAGLIVLSRLAGREARVLA